MGNSLREAIEHARQRDRARTLTGSGDDFNAQIRRLASGGVNLAAADLDAPTQPDPAPEPARHAAGRGDGGKQGSPSPGKTDMNALIRRAARGRW